MRGFVRRVRYHGLNLGERLCYLVVDVIKSHAVMYVAGGHDRFQYKAVGIAGRVRLVSKLPLVAPFYKQSAVRVGHAAGDGVGLVLLSPRQLLFCGVVPPLSTGLRRVVIVEGILPMLFPVCVHLIHQFLRIAL